MYYMFLVICRATHVIICKVKLSNLWRAQDAVVPDVTVGSTPWGERANRRKNPTRACYIPTFPEHFFSIYNFLCKEKQEWLLLLVQYGWFDLEPFWMTLNFYSPLPLTLSFRVTKYDVYNLHSLKSTNLMHLFKIIDLLQSFSKPKIEFQIMSHNNIKI